CAALVGVVGRGRDSRGRPPPRTDSGSRASGRDMHYEATVSGAVHALTVLCGESVQRLLSLCEPTPPATHHAMPSNMGMGGDAPHSSMFPLGDLLLSLAPTEGRGQQQGFALELDPDTDEDTLVEVVSKARAWLRCAAAIRGLVPRTLVSIALLPVWCVLDTLCPPKERERDRERERERERESEADSIHTPTNTPKRQTKREKERKKKAAKATPHSVMRDRQERERQRERERVRRITRHVSSLVLGLRGVGDPVIATHARSAVTCLLGRSYCLLGPSFICLSDPLALVFLDTLGTDFDHSRQTPPSHMASQYKGSAQPHGTLRPPTPLPSAALTLIATAAALYPAGPQLQGRVRQALVSLTQGCPNPTVTSHTHMHSHAPSPSASASALHFLATAYVSALPGEVLLE
ncbi:hypothetical protein KIPB_012219, partial [Kipferlia bialata]